LRTHGSLNSETYPSTGEHGSKDRRGSTPKATEVATTSTIAESPDACDTEMKESGNYTKIRKKHEEV
jgi:hypothetical protein